MLIVALSFACIVAADWPAPQYKVDLDAPASSRWNDVVTDIVKKNGWEKTYGALLGYLDNILPLKMWQELDDDIKKIIAQFPGDYAAEVKGFYDHATTLGYGSNFTEGQIGFMQLFYELNNVCTSIVAERNDGIIFHGRNLDYSLPGLPYITSDISFMKNGTVLYYGTQYVGYFGILTGMRPGGWSISVNQRFVLEIPLLPTIEAMINGAASVGFTLRDALGKISTYKEAMPYLSNRLDQTPSVYLNSPVYLIMAGVNNGEGTILTRNRNGTDESGGRGNWKINPDNGTWFHLETNDDNWKIPMDNRRNAANKMMDAVGVANADLDHMKTVLSTPPVLASHTTYTALMSAKLNKYSTLVRSKNDYKEPSPREVQLWQAVIDSWLIGHGLQGLKNRPGWQL